MIFGGGLVALALLAFWIFCIVDVIKTDETMVRNLPKIAWVLVVIFLPTIGSILWLALGRPERPGYSNGPRYRSEPRSSGRAAPRPKSVAPDDDPRFLAEIDERAKRLREWEEDLKGREDDLKRKGIDEPE